MYVILMGNSRRLDVDKHHDGCPSKHSLVQLPKTGIAVSDDMAVFSDIVPMIWSCTIAENGDIAENSDNT